MAGPGEGYKVCDDQEPIAGDGFILTVCYVVHAGIFFRSFKVYPIYVEYLSVDSISTVM